MSGESKAVSVGIVVPSLNAGSGIGACLERLTIPADGLDIDLVVSDGGSSDDTLDIAARFNARITVAEGGRGPQLATGADTAFGDWLLFVHADTLLPRHWPELVRVFAESTSHERQAAYFDLGLNDDAPEARRLERMVAWRCRLFGLPYGDQALLISRQFYEELGGYPAIPLMEDVALVRRIGKARLARFPAAVVTDARRYQRSGYILRALRNLSCLGLYFLGLPPQTIKRLYG